MYNSQFRYCKLEIQRIFLNFVLFFGSEVKEVTMLPFKLLTLTNGLVRLDLPNLDTDSSENKEKKIISEFDHTRTFLSQR